MAKRRMTAKRRAQIRRWQAASKRHRKALKYTAIGLGTVGAVAAAAYLTPHVAAEYHYHFGHGRGSSRRHFAEVNQYAQRRFQRVGYAGLSPNQRGNYDAYRYWRAKQRLHRIHSEPTEHGLIHRSGLRKIPSHQARGRAQVHRNQIAGHRIRNIYV